jgi:hypothetical protein
MSQFLNNKKAAYIAVSRLNTGVLGRNRTADTRIFNRYHFYVIEQTLLKIL